MRLASRCVVCGPATRPLAISDRPSQFSVGISGSADRDGVAGNRRLRPCEPVEGSLRCLRAGTQW
jgi:hypothetical protein